MGTKVYFLFLYFYYSHHQRKEAFSLDHLNVSQFEFHCSHFAIGAS